MCTVCLLLEQVDVVLGMNWLELNQVFTNCFDRSIQFLESKEDVDSRFLATGTIGMSLRENDQVLLRFSYRRVGRNVKDIDMKVQVRETMKDGAQVFVMLASLEFKGKRVVRDLPAMCEFLRVFPEDIGNLPPDREIDFSIDLVPGISPIFMALYEIFASELSELKK
ncbi:uncharacterized protein LOC127081840 [Lathyrus oleraceus]|uniref:uncharacterized protein LOC127081840 n=1 Tax=Pisum sativum TaxID=3888 RepID=UPI0021D0CD2F|nr:uncharacterized protein LOC127081840 [Pisum sativum]